MLRRTYTAAEWSVSWTLHFLVECIARWRCFKRRRRRTQCRRESPQPYSVVVVVSKGIVIGGVCCDRQYAL